MKVAEATLAFEAMPTLKVDGEVRTFAEIEVNGETFKGVDLGNGTYARLTDRPEGRFDVTLFHGTTDHDISSLKVSVTGGGVSRLKDTEGQEHVADNVRKLDHESISFGDEFLTQFTHQIQGGRDSEVQDDAPDLVSGTRDLSAPPQQEEPPRPVQVPPPSWTPPTPKTGMSKFFSDLTTSKDVRTQEKTSASLKELDKTTGEFLKMLAGLPKGSVGQAAKLQNFAAYMANIEIAGGPAAKRGVDMEKAVLHSFTEQIKTLSTKELASLADAFSNGTGDGDYAEALGELAAVIHKEIKGREASLDQEVRLWTDSVHKAISLHEGRLDGVVKDRDDRSYTVTDNQESVSNAFRGLIQCFNRAMMSESDPEKARAIVARVVGGLGSDGRRVLLEGMLERCTKLTGLPLMKAALMSGDYPAALDSDKAVKKGQDNIRESTVKYVEGLRTKLIDLGAEFLTEFGDGQSDAPTPMSATTHKEQLFLRMIMFQSLTEQLEHAHKEFNLPLPDGFEGLRDQLSARFSELTDELASTDKPLGSVDTRFLTVIEKACAAQGITSLDEAIKAEQLSRRKTLDDSFQAKLVSGMKAGASGDLDGLIQNMLGFIDLRGRNAENVIALSSNDKFGTHKDGDKMIDLFGVFADPANNVAFRRDAVARALETANLSPAELKVLQSQIQAQRQLIALLSVGARGSDENDKPWPRLTADLLITMDEILAAKTGVPAFDYTPEVQKMKDTQDAYVRALPEGMKKTFEKHFGYTLTESGQATPRLDRPFSQILEELRA